MDALRRKLYDIREAWMQKKLTAEEYKAGVLQIIREYLNSKPGAVEELMWDLGVP